MDNKHINKYIENFSKTVNRVKIIGMERDIPLSDIYVRVNLLDKIPSREGKSIEDVIKLEADGFGRRKQTTIEGDSIIKNFERIIILGKPGSGKTTFLKYLALKILEIKNSELIGIPILIYFRELQNDSSLLSHIINKFQIYSPEASEGSIKKLLLEDKIVLLFDGLDELSKFNNNNKVFIAIKEISEKYPNIKIAISCRTAAYNYIFEGYAEVEIADFSLPQISKFINNWFLEDKIKARACFESLEDNDKLKEISSSPLLLTLLCIVFKRDGEFPRNKSILYEQATSLLLARWDKSRMVDRVDIYEMLTVEQKVLLFSRIAYGNFLTENIVFRDLDLYKAINLLLDKITKNNQNIDGYLLLQAIESQHGMLVQRAIGLYSFSHLSFQEFFTAKHIVAYELNGTLEELISNYLFEPRWREVILFTSGILSNSEVLILLMVLRINKEIEDSKFSGVFSLLDSSVHYSNKNDELAFIKRFTALFILSTRRPFYEHSYSRNYIKILENYQDIYNIDLENTITDYEDISYSLDNEESFKDAVGFRGQDILIGIDILNDKDVLSLSDRYYLDLNIIEKIFLKEEYRKELRTIFKSCTLLFECMENSFVLSETAKTFVSKNLLVLPNKANNASLSTAR